MMQLGVIDANDMLIEADLDGSVYHVGLSWNEEGQLWTLSLRNLNFDVLASGIGVVPNWPLLAQVRQDAFPPGDIFVDAIPGIRLTRNSFVDGTAALIYFADADRDYVPETPVVATVGSTAYVYNPFAGAIVPAEAPLPVTPSTPTTPTTPTMPSDPDNPTNPDAPSTTNPVGTGVPATGTPYFTIASANSKCVVNSQNWPEAEITVSLPIGIYTPLFKPTFVANGSGKTASNFFFGAQPTYWAIGSGQAQTNRALTTADISAYTMKVYWNLTGGGLMTMNVKVNVVSSSGSTVPTQPTGDAAFLQIESSNTYAVMQGQTGSVANVRLVRPVYGGVPIINVVPKNTSATGTNLYLSSTLGFLGIVNDRLAATRDLLSTDDGNYVTTVFRNMSDGTVLQTQVNLSVAVAADTVNPTPTPVPTGPQIFFEDFNPGRGTGALVKTYLSGNIVNTPQGTILIDGVNGSCMTPVSPTKTNDGKYGFGNGLYEMRARIIGTAKGSGAGPAGILWLADDVWPGSEIDFVEINSIGQAYGAMHRKNPSNGQDQSITFVYSGLNYGQFNTYYIRLKTTETSMGVNGVEYGRSSTYAAPDFANGGVNHTIGVANEGSTTGIEVDWVRFTPEALLT